MNKLTGLKDTDREILKYINDVELLKVCSINKRFWYEICNDQFLRIRLTNYPAIEEYKREEETWKIFFSRCMYYVKDMKKYRFTYEMGDFELQHDLLQAYGKKTLLVLASGQGDFALVKYSIKYADVNTYYGKPLRSAASNGHLSILKYLIEHGADVKKYSRQAIKEAIKTGHNEIVEYLKSLN